MMHEQPYNGAEHDSLIPHHNDTSRTNTDPSTRLLIVSILSHAAVHKDFPKGKFHCKPHSIWATWWV